MKKLQVYKICDTNNFPEDKFCEIDNNLNNDYNMGNYFSIYSEPCEIIYIEKEKDKNYHHLKSNEFSSKYNIIKDFQNHAKLPGVNQILNPLQMFFQN